MNNKNSQFSAMNDIVNVRKNDSFADKQDAYLSYC